MSTYAKQFVTAVKASPDIDDVHLQGFIKGARASAGGIARAEKRRQMVCDHEYGDDGMCAKCGMKRPVEMSEFFSGERRLFIELGEDGLTDWKQITPGPGTYLSPRYGKMEITEQTVSNFVENFRNCVYQEHIPVDAEHKTKLSGALGYYRDMKVGHEGKPGVWAKIELTDRGRELLDGGGFKYFSPEFYPEWDDPASGRTYKDVITGGAFTTRPFFKDKSLQPILMAELESESAELGFDDFMDDMVATGASDEKIIETVNFIRAMEMGEKTDSGESFNKNAYLIVPDSEKPSTWKVRVEETPGKVTVAQLGRAAAALGPGFRGQKVDASPEEIASAKRKLVTLYKREGVDKDDIPSYLMSEDAPVTEEKEKPEGNEQPNQAAEDALRQLGEERTKREALEAQAKTFAEQNTQLTQRMAAMEAENRRRAFTEIVTGRGGASDGGPQWFGEPEQHVNMLEKLSQAFGEDSEELKGYIGQQNTIAKAMAEVANGKPLGQPGGNPNASGGEHRMETAIKAKMADGSLKYHEAAAAVAAEQPQLYSEYMRDFERSKPAGANHHAHEQGA